MPIKIDYKKCCWKDSKCSSSGCGCSCGSFCVGCVEACPVGIIIRKKKVEVNNEDCLSCGACVSACKHGAIKLIH